MSLTLYTARDNGKRKNGGNTTMVTDTTMVNNRIECGEVQSMFLCFCVSVTEWSQMELVLEEGSLLVMWWDI